MHLKTTIEKPLLIGVRYPSFNFNCEDKHVYVYTFKKEEEVNAATGYGSVSYFFLCSSILRMNVILDNTIVFQTFNNRANSG